MGLIFWMDNSKKARLEAYLNGKQELSKEKRHIMQAILKERTEKSNGKHTIPSSPKS